MQAFTFGENPVVIEIGEQIARVERNRRSRDGYRRRVERVARLLVRGTTPEKRGQFFAKMWFGMQHEVRKERFHLARGEMNRSPSTFEAKRSEERQAKRYRIWLCPDRCFTHSGPSSSSKQDRATIQRQF